MKTTFTRAGRTGALLLAITGTLVAGACSDDATAPRKLVPAQLLVSSGDGQSGPMAEVLPAPLVVQVLDKAGKPVPEVDVDWALPDGVSGSLSTARSRSDAEGFATTEWTMGTRMGTVEVAATTGSLPPARFRATVLPGRPARIELTDGDAQSATIGTPLARALAVRVQDAHGNAVPDAAVQWSVTSGGGTVSADQSTTDAGGVARTSWTLGSVQGTQVVTASVGTLPPVAFTATGVPTPTTAGFNLDIAGVHITQTVQTLGGTVPLVRGKPGLLRVFVRASEANLVTPAVRVRLYRNGSLLETRIIAAPGRSAPTLVDEGTLDGTWNLSIPASMIEPGLSVQVDLDPDGVIPETNEGDNVFPAGSPLSLDVRTPSTFSVRFVPVQTGDGKVGSVNEAKKEQFLAVARKLLPLNQIDADVRSVYVTSEQELQSNNGNNSWIKVLSEMAALRVAEASTRYYYGVVNVGYTSGVAGYGYVGGAAAVGWDYLPSGASVAAHEWGHNFGRNHAPCGSVAGADTRYPHAGGVIGAYGYNAATGSLVPSSFTDLMGYCRDQWISDYTYTGVLDFRASQASQGSVASAGVIRPSLLVWGRIHNGGVELEPAFEVATRTVVPSRVGDYTIQGFDTAGRRLWSFRFDPESVADVETGDRNFAFAIPADVAQPDRLARIQVSGKGRSDERRLRQIDTSRLPAPVARIVTRAQNANAKARARVSWDKDVYPMALIRDAATGEILAFARGGSAEVRTRGKAVDVILSHGVRSVLRRVEVRD